MATYEAISTIKLSTKNSVVVPKEVLPELVHHNDPAMAVYIDFSSHIPGMTTPQTLIDNAADQMRLHHQQMLLVEDDGQIIGLISFEDIISEKPLRVMHEIGVSRAELTVEMLMQPQHQILVMDYEQLKKAQVGHILNTLKAHSACYILVVKINHEKDRHLIKGYFSTAKISKQLHVDLSSLFEKDFSSISQLTHERK